MTEKFPRFMYNLHKGIILDNGRELMPHEAMKLLNNFNDENERIKKENEQLQKDCTALICSNQEYRKENEQLKNQNELLSDELEQCKAVIDKRWSEYLKKKELKE